MKKIYPTLLILTVWITFNPLGYAQEFPPPSSTDPQYVNGYYAGTEVGMAFCRNNPSACGISRYLPNGVSDEDIKNETMAQCQKDPSACEIDTDAYIKEGQQQCLNDPASCQIDTAAYTEAGRQQCQNDPASCDIEANLDTTACIEEGRQQCRNDPPSCGISINPDINNAIQETKAQCQTNPASCGIDMANCPTTPGSSCGSSTNALFSLSDGNLHLPAVEVPTGFDGSVTTYQVQMKIISGREPLSFSVTSAVPLVQ
ncbi:MAG: hypothetical protein DRR19_03100 [Candidatus Parabeggiatoa sp. nov. 1]|nr:MAG: hypothetical protein DRR19_03100 [Gammaproteobacteria bacterium]